MQEQIAQCELKTNLTVGLIRMKYDPNPDAQTVNTHQQPLRIVNFKVYTA